KTDDLRTIDGLSTAGRSARRAANSVPFTVITCDYVRGNGEMEHRMFLRFAGAIDARLTSWSDEIVPFPNSISDSIPAETTDADLEDLDYVDAWPVVCEDFTQWVLEDIFAAGRPAFDKVGVELVQDVVPYELMKLRLLNASHQGLCYFGYLAGHRYVHD